MDDIPMKEHRDNNEFTTKDLMKERNYIAIEIKLHGRPLPFHLGHVLNKFKRLIYEDLYPGHMFTDDISVEVIETSP